MVRIDDVSTNDMSIKHLDTTKDIVITPMKEMGGPVQLNTAHTWTAKVSDWANYIGDYPVTIESNSIVVNSSEFTSLPAGIYHLEVWEEWIDSNNEKQRSIYPSPQSTIDFNIYRNITDLAEKEIKTIGFQDVVDQAVTNVWNNMVIKVNTIESDQTATVVQSVADGKNYVTFNIPRGDVGPAPTLKIGTVTKLNSDQMPTANLSGGNGSYTLDMGIPQGETGTVDNAGLTNAPAFKELPTRYVNKSGDTMTGNLKAPRVTATDLLGGYHEVIPIPGTTTKIIDLINNNFLQGKEYWKEATFAAYNSALSDAPTNDLYSIIKLVTRGTSRTYVEYSDLSGNLWHTTAVGGTLGTWVEQANDSNVAHKTGNETIAGDKSFVGNTTFGPTAISAGNYGLRVTTSGIQKTTDGKTWVPANI